MQKPLAQSITFHLIIVIMLIASSWSIFSRREKIPDERRITVSLAPMGEKTNLRPAPKHDVPQEAKPVPKKPAPKPPEPKKPAPKPPEPKPEPKPTPKPEPKPEPKKVEPKPESKKEVKPLPEKKPEKQAEKKPEKTKKEKAENNELDNLLKDLDKKKPDVQPQAKQNKVEENTDPNSQADTPFDPNSKEAIAEQDYITKMIVDQIKPCWAPPAGVHDAQSLIVRVNVDIEKDGTMRFVGFENTGRSQSDPVWRVAADSARRAVLDPECNPLRNLPPPDKYYIWKEMTLNFDPKDFIY